MTGIDMLRKELADLEAALPEAKDYLEAKIEIDHLKWRLEEEEEILWRKLTQRRKSPV